MHRLAVRLAPWIVLAVVGGPAIAFAQDTYPPPTPPAEPLAIPPEPQPAPAPVTVEPERAPSPEAQPVGAPPEEPKDDVTGWFRIDSDFGGLQLWAGAAHPLAEGVSLASDIYVFGDGGDIPSLGEFDLGPAFTAGPAVITPMLGIQINFTGQSAAALVPQLYTIIDGGSVYFESWFQFYLYSVFDDVALDFMHTRDFVLFKASDNVSIGAEVDINLALKNKEANTFGSKAVYWLPVGPHLKLHYGAGSTLELFVGYDTVATKQVPEKKKLAGRFTFVQTW
jgi:hypothetical protein